MTAVRFSPVITRIKAIHWTWWVLWLVAMAMMGLMVRNHQAFLHMPNLPADWAERMRVPGWLLPIEIIALRDFTRAAGYAALVSLAFVCAALAQPARGPMSMMLAVGTLLSFLFMHTGLFLICCGSSVVSKVREKSVPATQAARSPVEHDATGKK